MEARMFHMLCTIAAVGVAAVFLIAYGEQRAARACYEMVTTP